MPAPAVSIEAYRHALSVAFAAARSAADRHRARLTKDPNVVDVRAGYKFAGGWVTDVPAVVVTVLRKEPPEAVEDRMLPAELDGIPVDVAPATPAEQLRHLSRRKDGARSAARTPPPPAGEEVPLLEPGDVPRVGDAPRAVGAGGRGYVEPKGLKLSAVSGAMTLVCHASPDAGWATLKKFLAGTKKRLTVAMYDFGAPHVFEAIRDAVAEAEGPFVLNLDRRSNPKREGELTEEEVFELFRDALGDKFEGSAAGVGVLYPNAYHIKVAVRDGSSFWLSSGNWQGSNQPEEVAAKLDEAGRRRLLSKRNREWHVVSDSGKLARTFEGYINHDVAEAARVAAAAADRGLVPPPPPDLFVPAEEEARAAAKPVRIFPAKRFAFTAADPVKVQPVLTPDNYGEHVVKLIRSAKKTLFFQNQYVKVPKAFPDGGGKPALKELVDALLDRMTAGVDVRIILRDGGDTRGMLQALKVYGFDLGRVRLQGGCHNKGIVVDSKAVLVSSQNYSPDGVRYNRDAGLIIRHPKVAKYFEQIFLYDWENRARQRVSGERGAMPLLAEVANAGGNGAADAGVRSAARTISWDEFYED